MGRGNSEEGDSLGKAGNPFAGIACITRRASRRPPSRMKQGNELFLACLGIFVDDFGAEAYAEPMSNARDGWEWQVCATDGGHVLAEGLRESFARLIVIALKHHQAVAAMDPAVAMGS